MTTQKNQTQKSNLDKEKDKRNSSQIIDEHIHGGKEVNPFVALGTSFFLMFWGACSLPSVYASSLSTKTLIKTLFVGVWLIGTLTYFGVV